MKPYGKLFQSIILVFLIAAFAAFAAAQRNSINGHVYDAQTRTIVSDVYVELQDSLGLTISRGKTDSAGRFFFGGLSSGTFNLKIITVGTNYQETIQEVRLVSLPTALDRFGSEYVLRKQYREAAKYMIRAIDVNRRSYTSFYALGVASYNLKNLPAAIEALNAATVINPQSINAQLFYGMVLRIDGSYQKAEKALLQAKNLAKNAPVAEIHWQLGLLYEKTSRYQEAADELEQYLKAEPKAANAEQIKKLIAQLRLKAK